MHRTAVPIVPADGVARRRVDVIGEVVTAILGNSDVRLTLNLYCHVQPEGYDRAAAAMGHRLAKFT